MDRQADPCVDFYAYACGGWQRLNPIPADQGYWEVYSKLGEGIARYVWGIFRDAALRRTHRTPIEARVGDYFASCMDEDSVEPRVHARWSRR